MHKGVGVLCGFRAAAMSLHDIRATHFCAQNMKRPEFIGGLHREIDTMLSGSWT